MIGSSHPCVDALTPAQRRILQAFCAGQLPAGQLAEALERARLRRDEAPAPTTAPAPAVAVPAPLPQAA